MDVSSDSEVVVAGFGDGDGMGSEAELGIGTEGKEFGSVVVDVDTVYIYFGMGDVCTGGFFDRRLDFPCC